MNRGEEDRVSHTRYLILRAGATGAWELKGGEDRIVETNPTTPKKLICARQRHPKNFPFCHTAPHPLLLSISFSHSLHNAIPIRRPRDARVNTPPSNVSAHLVCDVSTIRSYEKKNKKIIISHPKVLKATDYEKSDVGYFFIKL